MTIAFHWSVLDHDENRRVNRTTTAVIANTTAIIVLLPTAEDRAPQQSGPEDQPLRTQPFAASISPRAKVRTSAGMKIENAATELRIQS